VKIDYYHRKDCRLCGSKNLSKELELTPTPPADSYVAKEFLEDEQGPIPLDLNLCSDCGHTQIGHVINGKAVYDNYIYETVGTLGLGEHFEECAATVMSKFSPKKGGLVLDIGSNDGILLKYFKDRGMKAIGIDPMPGIGEKAAENGVETLPDYFDEEYAINFKEKYGSPRVICSNNLVADTDDLTGFVKGVKNLMDEDSIFFFETFYFYLQVNNNVWDFTYHEHYSYFTIKPLVNYFKKMGMELIDITPNLTKGGSMRVTVQLEGGNRKVEPSVAEFIAKEQAEGFQTKEVFKRYRDKIEKGKNEFLSYMDSIKDKTIVGYGASATSTTLIYHYELGCKLDYLVDDFSRRHGLFSPGSHLEIFPSEHINDTKPDYVVILAWRYYEKIISRHQKYIDEGGHFIIPLPDLRII